MKFLSPVYTAVSGSVGGLTYAHNAGGMYVRGRGTPVQPNTSRQAAVKAAMASMIVHWGEELTQAERDEWAEYAAGTPVTNALGATIHLSGQNMFIRANVIRQRAGLAIIEAGPTINDLGQPLTALASVTVAAGEIVMLGTIGGAGTSDTARKLIRVGAPQNVGRKYFRGPYQEAGNVAIAGAVTSFEFTATLADSAVWLSDVMPDVGDHLPLAIRFLYDDGRLSAEFREIVTVV